MICPGCNTTTLGRFAVTADTGEHIGTLRCRVTGTKYMLAQDVPKRYGSGTSLAALPGVRITRTTWTSEVGATS